MVIGQNNVSFVANMVVQKRLMKVCHIYRKPQGDYFSIEKIFRQITVFLEGRITVVQKYAPHSRLSLRNVAKNFGAIRKVNSDVYHITGDVHYLVLGLPGRKTILTIHDCVFLYNTSGIKRRILTWFFLKWPVRHCHLITTISEKSKNEIIKYSGCSAGKVVVVPNPVGELFYYSKKAFNAARPELLFIGSTPNKNLERVIGALEGLSCHLTIVGKVNELHKQLLERAGVSYQQVSGLSEQALADVYAGCDIVLFPSVYEGFGLPVIEGQKSGRPVITSNISPMKEVAGDGACLVDPFNVVSIKEGIERIIRDKDYREALVENGFDNVKQFEASAIAEKYLHVYEQITSYQSFI